MQKQPIAILKKKVQQDSIMYKIKYSNGSISIEPMTALTPDMLMLVQAYELDNLKLGKPTMEEEPKVVKAVKPNNDEPVEPKQKVVPPPKVVEREKERVPQPDLIIQDSKLKVPEKKKERVPEEEKTKGHKPRVSKPCTVRSLKNTGSKIEFQVQFMDDPQQKLLWLSVEELKQVAPVALCEFLLAKVKYGSQGKK